MSDLSVFFFLTSKAACLFWFPGCNMKQQEKWEEDWAKAKEQKEMGWRKKGKKISGGVWKEVKEKKTMWEEWEKNIQNSIKEILRKQTVF